MFPRGRGECVVGIDHRDHFHGQQGVHGVLEVGVSIWGCKVMACHQNLQQGGWQKK